MPKWPTETGWAFQEISRRYGDFALMGVAALLTVTSTGTIDCARLVFTGATPHSSKIAEQQLVGQRPDAQLFRDVATAAAAELETDSDIHASAEYRKAVASVLARRTLEQAAGRVVLSKEMREGQPRGVAPTCFVCRNDDGFPYVSSYVGADPRVCPVPVTTESYQ